MVHATGGQGLARAVFHARVFLTSFVKDEAATRVNPFRPNIPRGRWRTSDTSTAPSRPDVTLSGALICEQGVFRGLAVLHLRIMVMREMRHNDCDLAGFPLI